MKTISHHSQVNMPTQLVSKPFYLLRHGETAWNALGKRQGWIDIPLNDKGRQQAEAVKAACALLPITHIFHSPLSRAAETMAIACELLSCPRLPIEDLKEWHLGDFIEEGTTLPWHTQSLWHDVPTNGESRQQFIDRVVNIVNQALQQAETPLFVAHSGTFRALCHQAGIEITKSITNCQLVAFMPPQAASNQWRYELIASPHS